MKESNPKEHEGHGDVLAAAGLELTPTHLIAGGYRYRLDAIASYGPERQSKHYRKPALGLLFGILSLATAFGVFGGPSDHAGLVFFGVGLLLITDAVFWALMARRSPAVELISATGHRWRVALPNEALLPIVLAALDGAMGGHRR